MPDFPRVLFSADPSACYLIDGTGTLQSASAEGNLDTGGLTFEAVTRSHEGGAGGSGGAGGAGVVVPNDIKFVDNADGTYAVQGFFGVDTEVFIRLFGHTVTVPRTNPMLQLLGCQSSILSEKHLVHLRRMLPQFETFSMKMLTNDNDGNRSAAKYETAVRGHGNVLVVVKYNNRVFGGFHEEVFGNASWIVGGPRNFLFSMPSDGSRATKLKRPAHVTSGNFLYLGNCGCYMGDDLIVFCSGLHTSNVPSLYTQLEPGFTALPSGVSISGSNGEFVPQRMEVFEVVRK